MDVGLVDKMIRNHWNKLGKDCWLPLVSEAKYITGIAQIDAYLHYLETEAGLEIKLTSNKTIGGFNILNEEKFLMFALQWS